jgi:hypothetical protein
MICTLSYHADLDEGAHFRHNSRSRLTCTKGAAWATSPRLACL